MSRFFVNRTFLRPLLHTKRLLRARVARATPVLALTCAGVAYGRTQQLFAVSLFSSSDAKKDNNADDKLSSVIAAIQEADALYDKYLIDNAYNVLKRYATSEDSEVLWRLARVVCEKAKLCKDEKERKRLMFEAFSLVEKALKCQPPTGSFGANKWYAILLDSIGEYEGTKARIRHSPDVRKHLERALELNNKDATTWHILGIWHFTFADLPSYQRLAANVFFASPPTSTYEEALRHFERAESIQPKFYSMNQLYMGDTLSRLGRKEEARQCYYRAFNAPVVTVDDVTAKNKAFDAMKKMGMTEKEMIAVGGL